MRDPDAGRFAPGPLDPTITVEMHSKLDQRQRTANSQRFRLATSAMVFSDVTAQGMDFSNVSHVIQVGLPRSSDDYVHRIGRTGRAGKAGEGWLLLREDERGLYRDKMGHSGIKISESHELQTAQLDMSQGQDLPPSIARVMKLVETGIKTVPYSMKADVYRTLLGVLGQSGRSKQQVVDEMNDMSRRGWGVGKAAGVARQPLCRSWASAGVMALRLSRVEARPLVVSIASSMGVSRTSGQRGSSAFSSHTHNDEGHIQ